jgi:ABC-type glycerol-3-phosphate transport system permease component
VQAHPRNAGRVEALRRNTTLTDARARAAITTTDRATIDQLEPVLPVAERPALRPLRDEFGLATSAASGVFADLGRHLQAVHNLHVAVERVRDEVRRHRPGHPLASPLPAGDPKFVANYLNHLVDPDGNTVAFTSLFTRALVNSIGIALIATFLAIVVGTMAAYAIARLRFPGKAGLVAATLLIAMFPAISLVSPVFNLWRQLGLFDTWPGLIIPYLTFSLPRSTPCRRSSGRSPGTWSGRPGSTAPPRSRRSPG